MISYDEFFKMYRPDDIIFPDAVARYYGISKKEVYHLCDNRKDMNRKYIILCPICARRANEVIYDSIHDIEVEEKINCNHCDNQFRFNVLNDVFVIYQKQ